MIRIQPTLSFAALLFAFMSPPASAAEIARRDFSVNKADREPAR